MLMALWVEDRGQDKGEIEIKKLKIHLNSNIVYQEQLIKHPGL